MIDPRLCAAAAALLAGTAMAQTPALPAPFEPPANQPFALTNRDLAAVRNYSHVLLELKDPTAAYTRYAAADFKQHNTPFGPDRDSSIKTWLKVTGSPGSHFEIQSIGFSGSYARVQWHGVMIPGRPGMEVVTYFVVRDGKLREEWDNMTPDKDSK
jgi:predicted SnoaL-like aldol condensation-catalyzing enzyme